MDFRSTERRANSTELSELNSRDVGITGTAVIAPQDLQRHAPWWSPRCPRHRVCRSYRAVGYGDRFALGKAADERQIVRIGDHGFAIELQRNVPAVSRSAPGVHYPLADDYCVRRLQRPGSRIPRLP